MSENWGCHKCFLQDLEGFLGSQGPLESDILFEQSCERCHYMTVFVDELSIEVGKSKEYLNVVLGLWGRLGGYCFDLVWVHPYPIWADQVS